MGESCWITGWGYTDIVAGTLPVKLKQGQIPLVSRAKCAADHPTRTIDESMLCAGSNITGISGCQGDSGGPLVRKARGKWYLEGAFSWGADCNPLKDHKHQMYSNIRYMREWIDNTITDNQYAQKKTVKCNPACKTRNSLDEVVVIIAECKFKWAG